MTETHRITRAAYLETLSDFREFIREHCAGGVGVTDEVLYDLQLAVDEACTNIITHGYADMDPGSIILDIQVETGKITLTLTDFGHAFEPEDAPVPDPNQPIEKRELGGFGLFFIQQSVDEMKYQASEDGNKMTLTKLIPPPSPAAGTAPRS